MNLSKDKIEELVTPIVTGMGYEVWDLKMTKSKNKVLLRIFIDLPVDSGERRGISLDECGEISRQIGALFDVENPILGSYVLEVSSPGLNRALTKLEHYKRYIGKVIHVVLKEPESGRANFTGELQEVSDDKVKLLVDKESVTFLLTNIYKANLVPTF